MAVMSTSTCTTFRQCRAYPGEGSIAAGIPSPTEWLMGFESWGRLLPWPMARKNTPGFVKVLFHLFILVPIAVWSKGFLSDLDSPFNHKPRLLHSTISYEGTSSRWTVSYNGNILNWEEIRAFRVTKFLWPNWNHSIASNSDSGWKQTKVKRVECGWISTPLPMGCSHFF